MTAIILKGLRSSTIVDKVESTRKDTFHALNQCNGGKRSKDITILHSGCGNDCNGTNQVQRNTGEEEINSEWERAQTDQPEEVASG